MDLTTISLNNIKRFSVAKVVKKMLSAINQQKKVHNRLYKSTLLHLNSIAEQSENRPSHHYQPCPCERYSMRGADLG